jgi:LAGLIDADG endonuclease
LPRRPARGGSNSGSYRGSLPAASAANGNPEGSPSDPVTTDPKGEARRAAATGNTPALIKERDTYGAVALDPWFVTGLTEGEGCFCVSFTLRPTMRLGLEVRPSFALALNERDRHLLQDLQLFFGCGWIRASRSDRTFKYESRAVDELLQHVVPHFERYPLLGSKARSFEGFARICRMVEQGGHLERDGLRETVAIAYEMNLGKRRHTQSQLLRVLDEVKG